jgi:exoribonuclease R
MPVAHARPSLLGTATAVMKRNGFEPDFSTDALREVDQLDDVPPAGLRDLRALLWSSIDNRESRDLDQVEVAERLFGGLIRVRIGVADVGTLLPQGSAADTRAAANTTSVYTGVAVFPMLPLRLSTDLTSLNEGVDRRAVIIEFDVADDGTISNAAVYRALLRNHAKLTYSEVGAWLDGTGPDPRAFNRLPLLREQLRMQDDAAQRLRLARNRGGALNFDSVEASPVVVNGKVIDLVVAGRNRARDLIEDFMVAANRTVATYLLEHSCASLRRVVREPKRWDRIVALAADVRETLPPVPDSAALSGFLTRRRAADPDHFADLSLSVVKLLGPGVYVLEKRLGARRDAGHFGLGIADYVHSTAPNRRFADLVTQRMLYALEAKLPAPYSDADLTDIANRCTERGVAARKVERTMRKVAGASMLAERVGESFSGIVTAASAKGTYARLLSPPVEGRVVRGERGLDVGDTVRLKLVVADPERGYIDFEHDPTGEARKLARSRNKKAAADRLRPRLGERFDAEVTGVSDSGTWIRLLDGSAQGRVVRGFKALSVGMLVPVTLVNTDSVHGFIDFEYRAGVEAAKIDRMERKCAAARGLHDRIGDHFRGVVTGATKKATWVKTIPDDAEGRLVRGRQGLSVGDEIGMVLLHTDAVRGFIDFSSEDAVLPATP